MPQHRKSPEALRKAASGTSPRQRIFCQDGGGCPRGQKDGDGKKERREPCFASLSLPQRSDSPKQVQQIKGCIQRPRSWRRHLTAQRVKGRHDRKASTSAEGHGAPGNPGKQQYPYLDAEALGLDEGQRYVLIILPGFTDKVHFLAEVFLEVLLRGGVHHCGFDL